MRIFYLIIFSFLFLCSCKKDAPVDEISQNFTRGVFVINEGNFTWNNASISFIDFSTKKVDLDIFQKINNRPLGDVAQSMRIFKGLGFIIVNNSQKIEIVNDRTFESIVTITGFTSPRYIEFIDSIKAYVTDLYSNSISVMNLQNFSITKTIPVSGWTEQMVKFKTKIFVTNMGNSNALIIDTNTDAVVDSIQTVKEPNSIVIDKNEKIWVLCSGGYLHDEIPALIKINPTQHLIEKTFTFSDKNFYPTELCINSTKDTLYFLNDGIYQMKIDSEDLPEHPFIPAGNKLFYGLAIDPVTGNIFASDVVDYVQKGWVFRYNQTTKAVIDSFRVGIIPGAFCFTN